MVHHPTPHYHITTTGFSGHLNVPVFQFVCSSGLHEDFIPDLELLVYVGTGLVILGPWYVYIFLQKGLFSSVSLWFCGCAASPLFSIIFRY